MGRKVVVANYGAKGPEFGAEGYVMEIICKDRKSRSMNYIG